MQFRSSLFEIHFEFVKTKKHRKKTTRVEYFCQQLYSVGSQSLLEDNFQALLKSVFLPNSPVHSWDFSHGAVAFLQKKIKNKAREFQFACSGFVHTVICYHVNNIQVYLHICKWL